MSNWQIAVLIPGGEKIFKWFELKTKIYKETKTNKTFYVVFHPKENRYSKQISRAHHMCQATKPNLQSLPPAIQNNVSAVS